MIKNNLIKILAYTLAITGLFYNLVSADDARIRKINKIDAFIVCSYYIGGLTIEYLVENKLINKEDFKGINPQDLMKVTTEYKDIFNSIYFVSGYYYIEYDIFLFDNVSTVNCKVSNYYIYGKGINIEYVNEYYGLYYGDKLIYDGLERADTEDRKFHNALYKAIQQELNKVGIY